MSTEVYFNEPGYEHEANTPEGEKKNVGYSNVVRYCNVKFAIIEQIKKPPAGFESVVRRSMYLKREVILNEVQEWVSAAGQEASYNGLVNEHNSSWCKQFKEAGKYKEMMTKIYAELQEVFNSMESPFLDESGKKLSLAIKQEEQKVQAQKDAKGQGVVQISDIDMTYDEAPTGGATSIDVLDDKVKDRWSRYIGAMGIEAVAQ